MKRTFDFFVSVLGLVVVSPILLVICVVILVVDGRPVFFRQIRPGLHGRPFGLLKFRTMKNSVVRDSVELTDAERLTWLGRVLRRTSLDELPELWNVVRGEMSLVGPRPLLMEYLKLYTPVQARRHDVLPGITGWAQINGRNAVSWEQKFEMDVWYVENQSFRLDLKILFLTVWKVLRADGINAVGEATASRFRGVE
jgi:lipopolysaccharide/colanic/teichoic acid biosynthesis glycosyltransferase